MPWIAFEIHPYPTKWVICPFCKLLALPLFAKRYRPISKKQSRSTLVLISTIVLSIISRFIQIFVFDVVTTSSFEFSVILILLLLFCCDSYYIEKIKSKNIEDFDCLNLSILLEKYLEIFTGTSLQFHQNMSRLLKKVRQ